MNESQKNKIIGLGEHSFRKSYYPELQKKISELNIFKTIFDSSFDFIIIFNIENGRIDYINQSAKRYFKIKEKDILTVEKVIEKKYWDIVNDFIKIIHSNNVEKFKFKLKKGDTSFYLDNSLSIVKEKNESFGLLNIRDISESVVANKKLLETSETAKKHAQKKAGLLSAIPDLMFTFTKDGYIIDFNAPNESELFLSPELFLNKTIYDVLPPNIARLTAIKINEVLQSQQMASYTYEMKLNNSIQSFDARLVPLDNDNTLAIVRNITERVKMIKELTEAKEKAEEADHLKSTFLANMSHEIRTPLNGIVGFSNILAEKELDKETKKQFVKIINKSSNDLLRIINDILDISKLEAGQMSIKFEKFNLHELLDELYDLYKERMAEINTYLTLIKDYSEKNKDLIINHDETRIKQILINLLDNALKYTEKGFIKFGYKMSQNEIIFHVSDTGIGIKAADIDFIFNRFRQASQPLFETSGGTGLGLSICKGITEMLKGKIWVISEENKGSTFYFRLPL